MKEKKRNIAIGADHRGYAMKEFLKEHVQFGNITVVWQDVGAVDDERSDYPVFAIRAVAALREGVADSAVLLCGSGIGMAITANRYPNIYAGVVWNVEVARIACEHDNVNVLVLPSDYVSNQESLDMIDVWLQAEFKEGRYKERLALIDNILI